MQDIVGTILKERCGVQPGDQLVLGVSGGADSLCLMDLLVRLGYSPLIAHFDHQLRPGSAQDAAQVGAWAAELGLGYLQGSLDVKAYAAAHSQSLEEAARETRYRFLFSAAVEAKARAVVVAHTADDQVETVLMHLLRGSGLAGLRAMPVRALPNPWSGEIALLRPLLCFWRTDVLAYCADRGLRPLADQTNQDTTYFRNRLRHELIPYLESFNPGVRRSLWRLAELAQGDHELVQERVQQAWQVCLLEDGPGFVALNIDSLAGQPLSLRRYLLRQAAGLLRPDLRDIGYEAVERALEYLDNPERPPQIDWIAGLRLASEAGTFWIADWQVELPSGDWPRLPYDSEEVIVPGRVIQLAGGWQLHAEAVADIEAARQQAVRNQDPFQAWLALDGEAGPLVLHSRRDGDRIRPLGMPEGSIKVSELMINLKLPLRARAEWPLVVVKDKVAWIPGLRSSHDFRLTPATRRAVHLRLVRAAAVSLI